MGSITREQGETAGVELGVTPEDYQELLGEIEKALARFGGKPTEEGFDLEIYEELRRVRETLIRARRDLRDPNVQRDSRNPLGT